MKLKGTIVGLQSQFGSIYNVVTEDTRCYVWKASVMAILEGKMLTISFNWNGDAFDLRLSLLKENYYTGQIFFNREKGGSIFLWSFLNSDGLLFKGHYEEDDVGNYDCFIELKAIDNN